MIHYYQTDLSIHVADTSLEIDELMDTADKRLFRHISSKTHCLHHLLPPQRNVRTASSLRTRGHNFTSPHTDSFPVPLTPSFQLPAPATSSPHPLSLVILFSPMYFVLCFCVWTFIDYCILIVSLCDCHTHSLKATYLLTYLLTFIFHFCQPNLSCTSTDLAEIWHADRKLVQVVIAGPKWVYP